MCSDRDSVGQRADRSPAIALFHTTFRRSRSPITLRVNHELSWEPPIGNEAPGIWRINSGRGGDDRTLKVR